MTGANKEALNISTATKRFIGILREADEHMDDQFQIAPHACMIIFHLAEKKILEREFNFRLLVSGSILPLPGVVRRKLFQSASLELFGLASSITI
jgi:hypothetical protein